MTNIEKFNSKMFNMKIKEGWMMGQFMDFLEIDSEEEFKKELAKRFSPKACRDFLRRMSKNAKVKTKETREEHYEEEKAESIPNIQTMEETLVNEEKASDTVENVDTATESHKENLETLQEELAGLKDIIMEAEKNKAELCKKQRAIKEQLDKESKKVEEIRNQLNQSLEKVNKLIDNYNLIKGKIETQTKDIKAARSEVTGVEDKIKSLLKVSIFVRSSGEIESENFDIVELESKLDDELLKYSEADDLTMKMLKRMSQILKIHRELKREGRNFEIKFENETAELLFEKVTNASC